ncbi:MAG: hypothetical protein U9O83_05160, partial [Campylobacterota bacterium]|nr:hypothetical protein [Campylobacterota bacterium]
SLSVPIEVETVKPVVEEDVTPTATPTPLAPPQQDVAQPIIVDSIDTTSTKIMYPMRAGGEVEFDVSKEACEGFGFLHDGRVRTPDGPATVVGVRDGELWFHIDGQAGASFWGGCNTIKSFEEKGISRLDFVKAKARSGDVWEFSTSEPECMSFGFKHGVRVSCPKNGNASVVGVRDGHLWFHIDGDVGASFFSHKTPAEFESAGFRLLDGVPDAPVDAPKAETVLPKKMHPMRAGGEGEFDTSPELCGRFGFQADARVKTPSGLASVVGVLNDMLWFHVDGDAGASYWTMKTLDEFKARGFELAGPTTGPVDVPPPPLPLSGVVSGSEDQVVHTTRDGKIVSLDTGASACGSFGFVTNQRVSSPLGAGTVVGVAYGKLWMILDGERGVSYWTYQTVEDFRTNGVVPLDDIVQHPLRDGSMGRFKTTLAACSPFGFYCSQRVQTRNGPAKVVGVSEVDGNLYFHVDGDSGASYWKIMDKEEFERRGFKLLSVPRLASALAAVPSMAIPEVPPPSLMEELEAGKPALDISNATIRMFAVYHDQPVYTPRGFARVAGIREDILHFSLADSGEFVNFGSCGDEIVTKIHVYPLEEAGVTSIFFQSGEDKSKLVVETNAAICAPFGYKHGERVMTPNGEAHVVGVSDGDLWFYFPCTEGAIRWRGFHATEFELSGFLPMETAMTSFSAGPVISAYRDRQHSYPLGHPPLPIPPPHRVGRSSGPYPYP